MDKKERKDRKDRIILDYKEWQAYKLLSSDRSLLYFSKGYIFVLTWYWMYCKRLGDFDFIIGIPKAVFAAAETYRPLFNEVEIIKVSKWKHKICFACTEIKTFHHSWGKEPDEVIAARKIIKNTQGETKTITKDRLLKMIRYARKHPEKIKGHKDIWPIYFGETKYDGRNILPYLKLSRVSDELEICVPEKEWEPLVINKEFFVMSMHRR